MVLALHAALIASARFDMSESCRPDATAAFPGLESVSACREERSRVRQMRVLPNRVRQMGLGLIGFAGHDGVLDSKLLQITSYLCNS
jgi:hypothetical protein